MENNQKRIYKMLHKLSFSINEIPPLFVQLNILTYSENNQNVYWKEKARWIRFEERAEDVLGRWSKPFVSTVPFSAMDDLKDLINDGLLMFDSLLSDVKEISTRLSNDLYSYLGNNHLSAELFTKLFLLPHVHHHDKKLSKQANSSNNLSKLSTSGFLGEKSDQERKNGNLTVNVESSFASSAEENNENALLEYIYKENSKFKKKVNRKAEGATILVMPTDIVTKSKLVFIRLKAASRLPGFLEVKLNSRFVVLIIGPIEQSNQLYEIGRAISTCLADDICRELFYTAQSRDDLIAALKNYNRCVLVIPPSEWNPKIRIEPPDKYFSKEEREKNPELTDYLHEKESTYSMHDDPNLRNSFKPFEGLIGDISRKIPFYLSDIKDYFNLQSIATTFYIYLVYLCTLVIFGGLFGKNTDNNMATIECILAGAICTLLFSLFSGQPLVIISATGPVLILETIIKEGCDKYKLDFMEFRCWIGLWTFLFLLFIVIFNLSFLVKYITRFTEDCFACLVSVVFIIDAVKSTLNLRILKITDVSQQNNLSISSQWSYEDVKSNELIKAEHKLIFYFSALIFVVTFFICVELKALRNTPYFPTKIREVLSDFAVLIAIICTSLIDFLFGYNTKKLNIPSSFQPTNPDRPWIIPFYAGKNDWVTILFAIIPAILATILIFMDQQITTVIGNRKEFKLKKSHGYHLDLLVVSVSILICSILGLPWLVAATVLTLSHISSLKLMSQNSAPGEKPSFIGIREQRGTTFFAAVLLGLSFFFTKILEHIPMACLYGVFMFMGTSTLTNIQFVERILIIFMPSKYQPDVKYLRYVKAKRVHLFTFIQILSIGSLFVIKYIEQVAITFPILIVATCGIRKLLDFLFTQRELFWLDDLLPGTVMNNKQMVKDNDLSNYQDASNNNLNDSTRFNLLIKKNNSEIKGNYLTVNNNIESESNSTSIEHLNKNKHQNDSIKYIDSNNAIEIATD